MWPNPQETADLVTFTEGKLHFCAVNGALSGNIAAAISCHYALLLLMRDIKQRKICSFWYTRDFSKQSKEIFERDLDNLPWFNIFVNNYPS